MGCSVAIEARSRLPSAPHFVTNRQHLSKGTCIRLEDDYGRIHTEAEVTDVTRKHGRLVFDR